MAAEFPQQVIRREAAPISPWKSFPCDKIKLKLQSWCKLELRNSSELAFEV